MKRRLLNFLTALSLAVCVAIAALWVISLHPAVDFRDYVGVEGTAHAAVHRGRLAVYNTDLPYNGGIIGVCWDSQLETFGIDSPVYVRVLRWPGETVWVLNTPLYIPLILAAALPLLRLRRLVMPRVGRNALCPACGYDLRATPDKCPECGRVPSGANA